MSAWGMLLTLGGIFLMARWGLRLPRLYAGGAAAFAALTFNPLCFSIHNGFQPQMFGTAILSVLVALLSRCLAPCRWRPREAALVGLLGSSLASAYSEMLPLLALACLYCLATCARRAWAACACACLTARSRSGSRRGSPQRSRCRFAYRPALAAWNCPAPPRPG